MSKYLKNLITDHLRDRLAGVNDAMLVNVVGLDAGANHRLRGDLHAKNIRLMVVKNSLAARAAAGTPLAAMFEGIAGTSAICWGGEDVVTLAKEVTRLVDDDQYGAFEARGGIMDGEPLTGPQVAEVSRWPSRGEQISILVGQILSPGANLVSQLTSQGGALASQISQMAEGDEAEAADGPQSDAAETAAEASDSASAACRRAVHQRAVRRVLARVQASNALMPAHEKAAADGGFSGAESFPGSDPGEETGQVQPSVRCRRPTAINGRAACSK